MSDRRSGEEKVLFPRQSFEDDLHVYAHDHRYTMVTVSKNVNRLREEFGFLLLLVGVFCVDRTTVELGQNKRVHVHKYSGNGENPCWKKR